MPRVNRDEGKVGARPNQETGIAVNIDECNARGPTPGRYGCRAITRGDKTHKPYSQECRERAIKWFMRQEDPKIHERLTAAQARLESNDGKPQVEGESDPKRPKLEDPNDKPMEHEMESDTVDDEPSVASLLRLAVSPLPFPYLHACRYGNVLFHSVIAIIAVMRRTAIASLPSSSP